MQSTSGALAERLGTGLQNLGQRFDSARHLNERDTTDYRVSFFGAPQIPWARTLRLFANHGPGRVTGAGDAVADGVVGDCSEYVFPILHSDYSVDASEHVFPPA